MHLVQTRRLLCLKRIIRHPTLSQESPQNWSWLADRMVCDVAALGAGTGTVVSSTKKAETSTLLDEAGDELCSEPEAAETAARTMAAAFPNGISAPPPPISPQV